MTTECCGTAPAPAARAGDATIALVGNPNVGKSTLFNQMTGARQRVVNAPRTTVELTTGAWRSPHLGGDATLVDLPGCYDLDSTSLDEQVAADFLRRGEADLVVVLADATALGRSLFLVAQVLLTGTPVVLALTLCDVARSRGVMPSREALAQRLGIPVVEVDPRERHQDHLEHAVRALREQEALGSPAPRHAPPPDATDIDLLEWAHATVEAAYGAAGVPAPRVTASDKVDRLLLRPWVGIPVLMAVLWGMLQLITTVAGPLMDAVTSWWEGPVLTAARTAIPGTGWWERALVDGILAGVGVVLSFAPLMALTFLALAMLEDSGYLARAAVVGDRAMRAIGLNGQATLPLIIGYGCNLPALAALKTLPQARQRVATALLVPFTSCTARLPVYLLVASAFFPRHAGTVVFAMYVASAVVIVLGGLVMKSTLLRRHGAEATIMALPAYQRPRLVPLVRSAWHRTSGFVTRAGTVIVMALSVTWLISAVPASAGVGAFGQVKVEDSVFGHAAAAISPVFAPAGFDDWRMTSALVSGFVAKEIVVGSLAQSYALDEVEDPTAAPALDARLRETLTATSGGHPQAAAAAFLAFVLLYTPCVATVGEMRRQVGGRWTLAAVALGLTVAYSVAVAVFQLGRLW